MKTKLGYLLDNILAIFTIYLISFLIIRRYIHNMILIFLLPFVITFILSFLLIVYSDKKRNKTRDRVEKTNKINKMYDNLLFMGKQQLLTFLMESLREYNSEIIDNCIKFVYQNTNYVLIPLIKDRKITKEDYIEIYKNYNKYDYKKVILSYSEDISCVEIKNRFDLKIDFLSFESFYNIFLKDIEIPNIVEYKNKQKFKEILLFIFNKKRSKKYFLLTLIFSVYTLLFRYNLYYLFFSVISGVLTIYSLKNKRFNIDNKGCIL